MKTAPPLLLLAAALTACDERPILAPDARTPVLPDDPLEYMRHAGLYETVSDLESDCNGPGSPAPERTPYFRLAARDGYFWHEACATPTDCGPAGRWVFTLPPDEADPFGAIVGEREGSALCWLKLQREALVPASEGVRLETRMFMLEVSHGPGRECSPEEARRREAELPCVFHGVLVGRRVI